jgi:hypothetical protein
MSSRRSVARAGTHEHRPVIMGSPQRGPRDASVAGCPSRGGALGSFRQNRGWVRLAKCATLSCRRERRAGWSDPCIFLFFCRHRSRVYPRSAPNVRKSGKPDLRGPFQCVAVPDQLCTASRCTASGTRVIDCRIAFPSHQLNQSTLPRSRARIAASGLCLFASLTPTRGGRSAERRSGVCETPVGHAMTRRVRRLARRLASHDAGRSPLGAPPWRF